MPLEFVTPPPVLHLNVLLYGPPKSGKTIGGASAPGPVLLLNADRPNSSLIAHRMYGDKMKEVRMESLRTLADVTLAAQSGEYGTVVIDTIGETYRILLEQLSGRALAPEIQLYGDAGIHLERFCRQLVDLPINVVFVLHERPIEDGQTDLMRMPFTGTNNPKLGQKLMAMVDVIGYTGVQRNEDNDELQYVAQIVTGGGRYGGDRLGILGGTGAKLQLTEWVEKAHEAMKGQEAAEAASTKKKGGSNASSDQAAA